LDKNVNRICPAKRHDLALVPPPVAVTQVMSKHANDLNLRWRFSVTPESQRRLAPIDKDEYSFAVDSSQVCALLLHFFRCTKPHKRIYEA